MNVNILEATSVVRETDAPGVEQTDLLSLVKHRERAEAEQTLGDVYQEFQSHQEDFCAVLQEGNVVGMCSRAHLGFLMGHRYGFAIYSKEKAGEHMVKEPLLLRLGTPVRKVLELALGRTGTAFNEDVILLGAEDEYLGIIPVPALVQMQSALVEERFRIQETMHRRLLAVTRQAGMAEVATGVLHNVGNVLNSVNVSATLAIEGLRNSKMGSLEKVVALLHQKRGHLDDYLANDPKGKLVLEFLTQLTARLRTEQAEQLRELDSLTKHIGHIKSIVTMQQRYAKVSGILELVPLEEMVEDGLRLNAEALERHGVKVERQFGKVPPVLADRHKVLQILVNLITNAKQALMHETNAAKRLVVAIEAPTEKRVHIRVQDNGVGIALENLKRIFSHGFTTKQDGHGFGLHSAALAAKEMGGALHAHSDGPGLGARFTLELPVAPPQGAA